MSSIKTSTYTYSILQYKHSQYLGEVLNVGLLLYVSDSSQLKFIYPKKLSRISTVYPNVQEKTIRHYLRSFAIAVNDLNRDTNIFVNYNSEDTFLKFIANHILPPDSSSLQFSEAKKGILSFDDLAKTDTIDSISKKLYSLYFSGYESFSVDSSKVDDHQILSNYKRYLRENGLEIEKTTAKIQLDYEIDVEDGERFKFDIAWQNGSLNLVKPISFDLSREIDVQNKSFRFYGQFMHLQNFAEKENIHFDILLAKPKIPRLKKPYDNAVKLLSKPKRVRVFSEERIFDYSKKTVESIEY